MLIASGTMTLRSARCTLRLLLAGLGAVVVIGCSSGNSLTASVEVTTTAPSLAPSRSPVDVEDRASVECVRESTAVPDGIVVSSGEEFVVEFAGQFRDTVRGVFAVLLACDAEGDIGEPEWLLETALRSGLALRLPLPEGTITELDLAFDQPELPYRAPEDAVPGFYALCWETYCASVLIEN